MCPSCHSMDFAKLALIYNAGISHATVRVSGRFSSGYAVHQTELSRLAAPPAKRGYGKPIFLSILLYFLLRIALDWLVPFHSLPKIPGITIIWALLFWASIIAIVTTTFQYNRSIYPKKFRDWQNRFMCQRCGGVFAA